MSFEEIIWDVMEIKKALSDDADIETMWVLHKINQYRAIHIVTEYNLTNEIDPVWLQRIHKFNFTKTNAADDPAITLSSIDLGKVIIPRVIKLPDDIGTYRITGSSNISLFEPIDITSLFLLAELKSIGNEGYGYYSKVGDTIYITPYTMEGSAMIIAENPLDVKINDNGTIRDMKLSDDYPLDPVLAQRAILDLLTKDLAISEKAITDIVNDSQDEFKILKDDGK